MSQMRSWYKQLGLEPVEPLQDQPLQTRRPPMGEEKRDDGAGDPFKFLLEESLSQKRNEMMDNFAQILRRLPICDASTSSVGTTAFKVHINFDIHIFEDKIDADVVDKWLNLLEGYFSTHNFCNRQNITFELLKVIAMSNIGGRLSLRKMKQMNLHYL
jgi:hypothetical protein